MTGEPHVARAWNGRESCVPRALWGDVGAWCGDAAETRLQTVVKASTWASLEDSGSQGSFRAGIIESELYFRW